MLAHDRKFACSIIGLIFTMIVLVSTFSIIIPLLTIFFPGFLEMIFSKIFGNKPYRYIGISMIITLVCIFLISSFWFLKHLIAQPEKIIKSTIYFFVFQFFIIPPLFLYINISSNWDIANDGQFIFEIFNVFPASSVSFLIIGLLIDLFRMILRKKQQLN